jgi:hypothetical protein
VYFSVFHAEGYRKYFLRVKKIARYFLDQLLPRSTNLDPSFLERPNTSIWYWYGVGCIKFETSIFTEVVDAAYPTISTRHKKEDIPHKFNENRKKKEANNRNGVKKKNKTAVILNDFHLIT